MGAYPRSIPSFGVHTLHGRCMKLFSYPQILEQKFHTHKFWSIPKKASPSERTINPVPYSVVIKLEPFLNYKFKLFQSVFSKKHTLAWTPHGRKVHTQGKGCIPCMVCRKRRFATLRLTLLDSTKSPRRNGKLNLTGTDQFIFQ